MYNFLQWFLKNKDRKSVQTFNSSFPYVDDALSQFGDCLHLIYPNDKGYYWNLKICYLLWPSPSNDNDRRLKLYDKRDDFTFSIVHFLFISSNIPASPAYGIYISQLVRYSNCAQFSDCWTEQVSYKKQELLIFSEHMCSPLLFSGVRVVHRLSFCVNCGFLFFGVFCGFFFFLICCCCSVLFFVCLFVCLFVFLLSSSCVLCASCCLCPDCPFVL